MMLQNKIPPVHPGEVLLEEFIKPLGISQAEMARHLGITPTRLSDLIHGKRPVSGDLALRLARATNTTPEFWLNLQSLYELETARDHFGEQIEREVTSVMQVA